MLSTLWYGFFRLHSAFCIRETLATKKQKTNAVTFEQKQKVAFKRFKQTSHAAKE